MMKRYSYLIFLVLVSIVMTGCTGSGGSPGYGNIEGYVRYAGSQIPVADAFVQIGDRFDYTDSDGFFRMTGLSARSYTLSVSHAGISGDIHRQSVTIPSGDTNRLTVLVQPKGTASTRGTGYHIVIGIDDYRYESGLLDGPVEDAKAMYRTLVTGNKLEVVGKLLINNDASRRKIQSQIEEFTRRARSSDDYLVIYFSGNAGVDFLSPSDDDGSFNENKIITDVELESWVRGFPGNNVTLIIDGAHSATMADGKPFTPFVFRRHTDYTVLAGAQDGQMVTYDPRLGHSVFTYFLLEGLATRDADQYSPFGDITALELYEYTKEEMYHYFNRNWDDDYHVPYFFEGQYGDSVIYRY